MNFVHATDKFVVSTTWKLETVNFVMELAAKKKRWKLQTMIFVLAH